LAERKIEADNTSPVMTVYDHGDDGEEVGRCGEDICEGEWASQ
jgi:hypothetical protein